VIVRCPLLPGVLFQSPRTKCGGCFPARVLGIIIAPVVINLADEVIETMLQPLTPAYGTVLPQRTAGQSTSALPRYIRLSLHSFLDLS
jgi:hypothetical protein